MASITGFIWSQLITSLPYPSESHEGKTVIVTGSNVGLGKEAARHFTRLGAKTVILAVRSLEKGEEAKKDIESTTNTTGVVQVWELDLSKYDSVKKFAAKVKELERVDVVLANAGIATRKFVKAEENESTITVNVVSTFLLAFLMIPILTKTQKKFNTRVNLTIVASEVHHWAAFKERLGAPEGQIFNALNDESKADMADRYNVSKLLEVLAIRALAERYPSLPVTVNCVNPGLCHSELLRDADGLIKWGISLMKMALARTTEYGSRTLVNATIQDHEAHGKYMSDCQITPPSAFVQSEDGKKTQDQIWNELVKKLETIQPGVTKI
eukprot:TRINITY_DN1066_c0_g1_i1.p1 TRINITY_DN1066_c0_g1~~TRINITY_DN1066_c0_g1_i1.p1  ORF type:complete len:326 (-),score=86.14 TRINITY_DN1066_c0_g1_i1:40-1017(-)